MAYSIFEEVIELIENDWSPKGENIDEHCNRDDLLDFLQYELKQKKIPVWMDENKVKLTKLGEGGFFDIGVDKKIVIGFMMGLRRQEHAKALMEHIQIHIKQNKDIIIVLLGQTSKKVFKSLKEQIDKLYSYKSALRSPSIQFIEKCAEYIPKSEQKKEGYEIGGGSAYYG